MDNAVKTVAELLEDNLDLIVQFNQFVIRSKITDEVCVYFLLKF